jgi:hypothetical protein
MSNSNENIDIDDFVDDYLEYRNTNILEEQYFHEMNQIIKRELPDKLSFNSETESPF